MCLWWTWFMMNVSDDDRLSWWTCLIMKVSNDERISLWTCLIIWLMMNVSDDERISWCILWWMCLRMCLMMNVSDNGKCLTINVSRDEWRLTINVCWRAQVISMEHVHHNMNVSEAPRIIFDEVFWTFNTYIRERQYSRDYMWTHTEFCNITL